MLWGTYQFVCWSSMMSSVLHLSLLYAGFWGCEDGADDVNDEKIPPAVFCDLDGELGALGDGPFLEKFKRVKFNSSSFLSSPCRSPELNLLRRKFIPPSKVVRKFANEILTASIEDAAKEVKLIEAKKSSFSATVQSQSVRNPIS